MNDPFWIWQQPDWPHFSWQAETLAPLLRACGQTQGRLMGMLGAVGSGTEVQSSLDPKLQNIVTSSAIEGEQLNVGSVRSSLARRPGLNEEGPTPPAPEAWQNCCSIPPVCIKHTDTTLSPMHLGRHRLVNARRLHQYHGFQVA